MIRTRENCAYDELTKRLGTENVRTSGFLADRREDSTFSTSVGITRSTREEGIIMKSRRGPWKWWIDRDRSACTGHRKEI